jgi:hypothetical protein
VMDAEDARLGACVRKIFLLEGGSDAASC